MTSPLAEYLDSLVEYHRRFRPPLPEGFKYGSYEALVRAEGTWVSDSLKIVGDLNGPVKNCYENSLTYALENGMLYVEGYAWGSVIPVMHAWVFNPETGEVIETTWREPGSEYYGIALDPYEALGRMGDFYGLLANDWLDDHRLLREGFPNNRFVKE